MTAERTNRNPRGAGRKLKLPADKYKTRTFKCTDKQREEINRLAELAGLPTNQYIRTKALES
ncbi:MAG TPA: hypothetical protein DCZ10_09405 [Pelotomaculum sp.]|nr:hypothetical protein [Pelotomaculum sp.]